jgi:hypothetical protein
MLMNCAGKKDDENDYNHNLKKKLFSDQSQIKPVSHLIATFSKIHYTTVLPSTFMSLKFVLPFSS